MGLVDGFFLLGLFLFGVPLAALVGTLLGKLFGMPRLGGCLPGLVLLTIMFGVPVALRMTGVRTTAQVQQKRERVNVFSYTGTWYNSYNLVVHFQPPHAARADRTSRSWASDSVTLSIAATRELFDRARVGSAIDVVYLPYRPSIGKLADRSLSDLFREMLAVPDIFLGLVMVLAIGLAVWLSTRPLQNSMARSMRALLIAACLGTAITAMWFGYRNPASVPETAVNASGVGHIVQVRRVDMTLFSMSSSNNSSSPLAQPFDVIEVEFTPPLLNQVVHAADAVDTGSLRGLDPGLPLRIHYDALSPRTMRIDGGTRTFRAKNARDIAETLLIVLLFAVGFVGLSALFARRKSGRRSAIR